VACSSAVVTAVNSLSKRDGEKQNASHVFIVTQSIKIVNIGGRQIIWRPIPSKDGGGGAYV